MKRDNSINQRICDIGQHQSQRSGRFAGALALITAVSSVADSGIRE